MNTKRFFALVLTLVLVFSLVLLTPTETKAEGFESDSTEIDVDPYWGTYFLEWNDPDTGTVKITEAQISPMDELYITDVGTYAYTASGHSDETCTEPEKTVYTVSFSYRGRSYSASNTYLGEPALGHDWTDWVNNGDTHYRLCQREGCGAREEVAHTYGNWTYVDDSTCKGVCVCGAEKTEAHYDQFETKCAHQPHCEKCGHDYGTIPEHRMWYEYKNETYHNPNCFDCDTDFPLEAHSGGTATCTSSPICEKCGHEYGSPDPDAHDWGDWEYLNETQHQRKCRRNGCTATETEDHSGGTATCTEKAKCETCGQAYGDPLGHDWQPAYDSMRHYNKCSRCDTIQEGTEYDHDWHQEVEWNADRSRAHSTIWCDCGYREEDYSDYSGVNNRVEPTCTKDGSVTYWATFARIFHSRATITDPIPALGHAEVIDEAVLPTCTETGLTEGKHCSVCNAVLVAQEVVKANGHTEVVDPAKAPTCTATGLTEGKHCSVCNAVLVAQEVVKAKGHTEVVDPAVPSTCTETGLTAGKHCSVCNTVLVAQEVVPALDHDWVVDEAVAPTCTKTGLTEGKHCSRCPERVAQEVVPALGHDWIIDKAVAPTCTETGLTEGKHCSRCDVVAEQVELPALGHAPGKAVKENEVPATDFEAGSYDLVVYCTVCREELRRETVNVPAQLDPFTQFSLRLAERIRTAPENGTVEADAGTYAGLTREVFEALNERADVTLKIACQLDGQRTELTIPAGFDLLTPLGDAWVLTFAELAKLLG